MAIPRKIVPEGARYHMLTAVGSPVAAKEMRTWICDCGKRTKTMQISVTTGKTKSCGCLLITGRKNGYHVKHRKTESPEFNSWCGMKSRCLNPKNAAYPRYGGRGISVSPDWVDDFQKFYDDMGHRPSPAHSLDRDDNNGPYSKDNCRWATPAEQSNNRRSNLIITVYGKTMTAAEAAKVYNLPYQRLWQRLKIYGWSPEKAVSTAAVFG